MSFEDLKQHEKLTDLLSFHEENAGSLVVDPEEAKIMFGEAMASNLKLSQDGSMVLWPQPTDAPEDPQNWSNGRKTLQLIIVTMAAAVPDFDSGIGIAAIFPLAEQYRTTTGVINDLTSNWSIFLIGWGGLFAVMLMRRYGRLPVLFWSQLLAMSFMVGATFAPNLNTFAAMRCLAAFFGTCPQVTGLYVVTDIYPFHLQARKLSIWTMGFLISPVISPFVFGFLVAKTSWRWAYGIGSIYGAIVLFLIAFFMEETIYDRTVKPIPTLDLTGFKHRLETLIGITGMKMARYRPSWSQVLFATVNVFWRPHLLGILIYEAMLFGFAIGMTVTNVVFLVSPQPFGFGFSQYAVAGVYGTPIVGTIIGELVGQYLNDWIMDMSIRKNKGIFEPESRLWACSVAIVFYFTGFLMVGTFLQGRLGYGVLIIGWGFAQIGVMMNTVAVYAYSNDCFPKHKGEISAAINLARTLGGFSVAYYQVQWVIRHGAMQAYGVEAAVVASFFVLIVPALQLKGKCLRVRFSL